MTDYPSNEERTLKYFEKFNRETVLKSLIKTDSPVIFDVGANNGSSTLEFKQWWKNGTIHCFEPQKECWEDLKKLKLKYAPDKVFVNEIAASNSSGKNISFYTHDVSSGLSGFNKVNMESIDSIEIKKLQKKKKIAFYLL